MVDFKKVLAERVRYSGGLDLPAQRRHMADEQTQAPPTLADLDQNLLDISSEEWATAGLIPAGKVGFKIITSTMEAARDKNGVYPRAELEIQINARPDREVSGKGERMWPKFRLDDSFIRQFKNLATAAGIKFPKGQTLKRAEVVKSLAGQAAFGTIIHREWIGRGGEKNLNAEFGNRFGKSFKELG